MPEQVLKVNSIYISLLELSMLTHYGVKTSVTKIKETIFLGMEKD